MKGWCCGPVDGNIRLIMKMKKMVMMIFMKKKKMMMIFMKKKMMMVVLIPLLMTGLLPVRMSMSSIASIDAIGARPLTIWTIILLENFISLQKLGYFLICSFSLEPQVLGHLLVNKTKLTYTHDPMRPKQYKICFQLNSDKYKRHSRAIC